MTKRQRLRKAMILISYIFFPITIYYFSPVLPVMGAYSGIITGSIISFTAVFIFSLGFGRFGCGWICPAAGLEEACFPIQDRPVKSGNRIKYFIWAPWIAAIIFLLVKAGGIKSIDPLYQTWQGISVHDGHSYIVFFGFTALIVFLSFTVGKRSFCHHVCWVVPFMVLGRKIQTSLNWWPSLRLKILKENCVQCGRCSKGCPMSLEVMDMVKNGSLENSECILCGACADSCKKKVIHFSFSKG